MLFVLALICDPLYHELGTDCKKFELHDRTKGFTLWGFTGIILKKNLYKLKSIMYGQQSERFSSCLRSTSYFGR